MEQRGNIDLNLKQFPTNNWAFIFFFVTITKIDSTIKSLIPNPNFSSFPVFFAPDVFPDH